MKVSAQGMRGPTSPDEADSFKPHLHPDSLRRQSISGSAVTFAAQGLRFVVQTVSQIVLARLIRPENFGLVAMAAPLIGLVQLVNDLGLSQVTIQRPEISPRELSALFWLNVSSTLLLSFLVAALAPAVSWFYAEPGLTLITTGLAVAVLLAGLSAQHMALLNRRMQFGRLAGIDVASTAVAAFVGLGAAEAGLGIWALVLMQVANAATILVLSWILARWRPSRPRTEHGIGSFVTFGGSVTAYNVFEYVTMNLDNVLVGAAYGGAALGFYDRAYKLMIQPLGQITTPFTRVAVPLLSRLQGSPETYRQLYLQMLQAMLVILAPAIVFAILEADTLVRLLLGEKWLASAPIFAWLAGGALILPVSNSTYWLFVSQNRVREQMFWGGAASAAILLSFLIGLPWGPIGVARSSTICYWIIHLPVLLTVATRDGPVRLRHVVNGCSPILAGAAIASASVFCADSMLAISPFPRLLVTLLVAYVSQALVLAVLPAGQRMLRDAWSLRSAYTEH